MAGGRAWRHQNRAAKIVWGGGVFPAVEDYSAMSSPLNANYQSGGQKRIFKSASITPAGQSTINAAGAGLNTISTGPFGDGGGSYYDDKRRVANWCADRVFASNSARVMATFPGWRIEDVSIITLSTAEAAGLSAGVGSPVVAVTMSNAGRYVWVVFLDHKTLNVIGQTSSIDANTIAPYPSYSLMASAVGGAPGSRYIVTVQTPNGQAAQTVARIPLSASLQIGPPSVIRQGAVSGGWDEVTVNASPNPDNPFLSVYDWSTNSGVVNGPPAIAALKVESGGVIGLGVIVDAYDYDFSGTVYEYETRIRHNHSMSFSHSIRYVCLSIDSAVATAFESPQSIGFSQQTTTDVDVNPAQSVDTVTRAQTDDYSVPQAVQWSLSKQMIAIFCRRFQTSSLISGTSQSLTRDRDDSDTGLLIIKAWAATASHESSMAPVADDATFTPTGPDIGGVVPTAGAREQTIGLNLHRSRLPSAVGETLALISLDLNALSALSTSPHPLTVFAVSADESIASFPANLVELPIAGSPDSGTVILLRSKS